MNLLLFILGLLFGLTLSFFILVLESYLKNRGFITVEQVVRRVDSVLQEPGAILEMPTEEEEAREDIIKRNELIGKDTPLEDII